MRASKRRNSIMSHRFLNLPPKLLGKSDSRNENNGKGEVRPVPRR
jgi:hypothetical protein